MHMHLKTKFKDIFIYIVSEYISETKTQKNFMTEEKGVLQSTESSLQIFWGKHKKYKVFYGQEPPEKNLCTNTISSLFVR